MAKVYKRTDRKPIPANANITQQSKPLPTGAVVDGGVALWTDRDGCQRTAILNSDGKRIRAVFAEWTDSKGTKSAPVDHTETALLLVQENWTADYTVGTKRYRKSTRVTDKAVAQRIANQWEADDQLRREGVIDQVDESLARYAAMPISQHVDAFLAFRATNGGTEDHRNRTRKHIVEFVQAGGWNTIRDIDADDVTQHVDTMKKAGSSARTIQARLQSIKSFTKWLAQHHRIKLNPLSMVSKPNPKANRSHERRMLLPSEWQWLSRAVAESSEVRNGMTPDERLLLYRLAIQTGLRASEIDTLTRGKLVLDGEHPHAICKAAGTKNRKPAKQYIDRSLAADLKQHGAKKHPNAKVFRIAALEDLAGMVKADLSEARNLWIQSLTDSERIDAEQSDFLTKTNHEGEHLVFHSLRHTCGAWLAMAAEHPKVVQTVMRHASIVQTMDTYGHLFPGQCETAPVKLAAMMNGEAPKQTARHPLAQASA